MTIATILTTLLLFALVGFVVYLVITYIPMPDIFQKVIMVVCAILLILYIIGMITGGATAPALHLR